MLKYDKAVLEFEDDQEENEILVDYDIATYPSDFTLNGIVEMWNNKSISIPEFQREFVWSIKQSSLLIESFLLGLPVPPVFFYVDHENRNLVIDGQQRILSVVYYFDGYFGAESLHGKRKVFRLKGLDERSPYFDKKFEELDGADRRKLENSVVLRAINVRQLSPKKDSTSVYHIFERLNTGGTPLQPQEVRNCVFRGDIVKTLKELNLDINWRKIIGKPLLDRHQRDVELILRLFALSRNYNKYEKPMKEFLNITMNKNRNGDSPRLKKFVEKFQTTCFLIIQELGEKPFHLRGPMNTSALDSVFCTLMDNSNNMPNNLSQKYDILKKDEAFYEYTTAGTTDSRTLKKRFELVKKILIDSY